MEAGASYKSRYSNNRLVRLMLNEQRNAKPASFLVSGTSTYATHHLKQKEGVIMKKIILTILIIISVFIMACEFKDQSLWWVHFVALGVLGISIRLAIKGGNNEWNNNRW